MCKFIDIKHAVQSETMKYLAVDQIQPLDTPADNVIIPTDTVADPPDVTGVSASGKLMFDLSVQQFPFIHGPSPIHAALSSGNATGTFQKWYAVLVGCQPGIFYGPYVSQSVSIIHPLTLIS